MTPQKVYVVLSVNFMLKELQKFFNYYQTTFDKGLTTNTSQLLPKVNNQYSASGLPFGQHCFG